MNLTICKLIAVTAVLIHLMSGPVVSEIRDVGHDESPKLADSKRSNIPKQSSIILAEEDNRNPDDKEKATSGSETNGSGPESKSAAEEDNKSSEATSKPLKPFVPSEKIPGDQAVDFPVDI